MKPLVILLLLPFACVVNSKINTNSRRNTFPFSNKCYLPGKADGDDTVSCRARIPAWSFNYRTGVCEYFVYGGCGGNDNRFYNPKECVNRCLARSYEPYRRRYTTSPVERTVTKPAKCNLPGKADGDGFASCRAYIPSWSYNPATNTCEYFVYGGCGGNDNRYVDPDLCVKECGAKSAEPRRRRYSSSTDNFLLPSGAPLNSIDSAPLTNVPPEHFVSTAPVHFTRISQVPLIYPPPPIFLPHYSIIRIPVGHNFV